MRSPGKQPDSDRLDTPFFAHLALGTIALVICGLLILASLAARGSCDTTCNSSHAHVVLAGGVIGAMSSLVQIFAILGLRRGLALHAMSVTVGLMLAAIVWSVV